MTTMKFASVTTRLRLCLLGGLLLVAAVSGGTEITAPEAATVPHWGRFEGTLPNATRYADPFRDVTLETEFTRPDGSRVGFWGFHDGGVIWRFRVMADQVGDWTYRVRFSDGTGASSGRFRVVPSDRPGMLEVHPENPIWFGRRGGGAHLVRALHVGDRFFAANWPETERRRALQFIRGRGYNMISVASHYLNRRRGGRGEGWETPALWPLNPLAYARLEKLLDECASLGLDVYPFAGFFGKHSNAPTVPADQELYVRYTLARLAPMSHLVLNAAGPEPNHLNYVFMESRDVERLGRMIARWNVFGHPLSLHNAEGDDEYKHSDWTTFGTLQGPKTLNRADLGKGLRKNHHWAKPLFAQETLWTGNINHPAYSMEDLRKNAWVIAFSAANLCFADNQGNSSTGFSGTLDPGDARVEAHDLIRAVWDAFETLPFGRLRPDYQVGGGGWCLSDGVNEFVLYFDRPVSASLNLPTGADFAAVWINPRDPSVKVPQGSLRSGQPMVSPEGGEDWLLHLKRVRPGTTP